MKRLTGILPVLMIAILSTFFTGIQGRVLAPLSTGSCEFTAGEVNVHPSRCAVYFTDFTSTGCDPATGLSRPVTPYEGSGSAEVYSYPLATGTLTGNVKICATNVNLAGVTVTIMAGTPPIPYTAVTHESIVAQSTSSANVTVVVSLSCPLLKPGNATVTLSRHNPGTPPPVYDSVYILVTDTSGIVHFNNICTGVYDLLVTDFDYDAYTQNFIAVTGNMTISLTLQQVRTPLPASPGLLLDDKSLLAKWARPHLSIPVLTETWDSGNFTANGWTTSGSAGGNWIVGSFGYPSSSAEFKRAPLQTNYDGYLTSKVLTGLHSPVMTLNFDIYLHNYAVINVNTMAVEVWNGTSWSVLKTYTNQGGSIVWSMEHLDISFMSNSVFQIRFHAAGTDNASIANWNIDNITITATGPLGNDPCVQGYNFYLNNIHLVTTIDTSYSLPTYWVGYGVTYDACVEAIYDSGSSTTVCTSFTSHSLCPVTGLSATAVTNAAYLSWTKPHCHGTETIMLVFDDGTMENAWSISPGVSAWLGNLYPVDAQFGGFLLGFDMLWRDNPAATNQDFQIDVFSQEGIKLGSSQTFHVPIPAPSSLMNLQLTNAITFNGPFYAMVHWNNFTGVTHSLGSDEDGTYASQGLAYYYDGTTFSQWNNGPGPSVFCLDAFVLMNKKSPSTETGLVGYNVYQVIDGNSTFHHYVPGPDSLSTYCFNLDPGLECFDVTAKYDLSAYGFPGTFGESLPESPEPVCIALILDSPWPFFEPWNGGSFGYQQWTNESNWVYYPGDGNPPLSAKFSSQPVLTGYNSSLTSPPLYNYMYSCASIWLDFDYKLEDLDANGTEKMDVEVKWDHKWHLAAELINNGSVDWTSKHLDISQSSGQAIKIRFRANGTNTQHILNWYIDNIKLYAVCSSPVALEKTNAHDTINLTWSPPQCGPIGQLICFNFDDDTSENGWAISPGMTGWLGNFFPVADSVSGKLHSFDLFWKTNPVATSQDFRIDVFSHAGALLGSSQTFQVPYLPPATFMTITLTNDIPFSGSFYGMVRWNNFPDPTNFIGFDQDGPYASQDLAFYFDGTTFTHLSIVAGNGIPGVFTERVCAFTFGQELSPDSNQLIGYNLFRYDSLATGVVNFHKLNTSSITATSYTDIIGLDYMEAGFFKYFVTAMFNSSISGLFLCESPGSDTIGIRFPLIGVEEIAAGPVLIYPNPVNDLIHVKSDYGISRIEVLNFTGQSMYIENTPNPKLAKISTSSLQAGVYIIRISTSKGIRTAKFTVVR